MDQENSSSVMAEVSLSDNEDLSAELGKNDIIENGIDEDKPDVKQEEDPAEDLSHKVEALESERGQLTVQLMAKDELIAKLELEVNSIKAELKEKENQCSEQERKFLQVSEELGAKVTELKKQYVNANKEKESMVMKYALNEKEIIIQKKHRDEAEKKMKQANKEKDEAVNKAKNAIADKLKLQQLADSRLQDSNVLKREIERWKEEVKVQEAKATLSASKLKAEMDSHKETKEKLDANCALLSDTRAQIETTQKEYSDFIKKLKDEDDAKQKRQKAAEQEQSVKLMIDEAAASELITLKDKHAKILEEHSALTTKVQTLDSDKTELETNLNKSKETIKLQKNEIEQLMAQVAEMESCKLKLSNEEDKVKQLQMEMNDLKTDNSELVTDMDVCRKKEAELLNFTEKLTETNAQLQSDLTLKEARASALENEHSRLSNNVSELEANNSQLKIELDSEAKKRLSETQLLAKKLAETTKNLEAAKQKVSDANNEVLVLKRKNQASIRELTRELKENQRKLESIQQGLSPGLSHCSRASSNSSLNKVPPPPSTTNGDMNDLQRSSATSPTISCSSNLSGENHQPNGSSVNNILRPNPQIQVSSPLPSNVPDSQVLVEKIVKLQKELAKRQEKLDFMEEHVSTMVGEMKKKNRLLQNLMMKQEPGALASADMDDNKLARSVSEEKRAAEHGGIMSSLYSSKANDTGMTLELSLEINQKLQAVLEDTLLKNITLKENINTLGKEIAILSTSQDGKSTKS